MGLGLRLRHESLGLFRFGQDRTTALVESLPHLGDAKTPAGSLDEAQAQALLEAGDPPAEL